MLDGAPGLINPSERGGMSRHSGRKELDPSTAPELWNILTNRLRNLQETGVTDTDVQLKNDLVGLINGCKMPDPQRTLKDLISHIQTKLPEESRQHKMDFIEKIFTNAMVETGHLPYMGDPKIQQTVQLLEEMVESYERSSSKELDLIAALHEYIKSMGTMENFVEPSTLPKTNKSINEAVNMYYQTKYATETMSF